MPNVTQYLTKRDLELAENFPFVLGLFFFVRVVFLSRSLQKCQLKGGEHRSPSLHQLYLFENHTLSSPFLEMPQGLWVRATASTKIVFGC